jgi:hypothetical protein
MISLLTALTLALTPAAAPAIAPAAAHPAPVVLGAQVWHGHRTLWHPFIRPPETLWHSFIRPPRVQNFSWTGTSVAPTR